MSQTGTHLFLGNCDDYVEGRILDLPRFQHRQYDLELGDRGQ